MSKKELVLVGYSGHGTVVGEALKSMGLELRFYTDKSRSSLNPLKLEYLGFEGEETFVWSRDFDYVLGIGDNTIRRRTGNLITSNNRRCLNVFHSSSSISDSTRMGFGNFVSAGALINALVHIGNYCIVNTGAIIEHECQIGNAVHVAPGAVLAGNVVVGDNSFIGANSVIKEGVRIGANVVVGAGTVVIKDVENNNKIVGNPGRVL